MKSWGRRFSRVLGVVLCAITMVPGASGHAQDREAIRSTTRPGRPQKAVDILRQAQQEARAQQTRIARATYERALAAAVEERDKWTEVSVRRSLGILLRMAGERKGARAHFEAALTLCEELKEQVGLGWTLHELGWMASEDAQPEEADRLWRRGIAAFEAAGYARGRAELMHNRLFVLPAGPEKRALLQEGLELARTIGDRRIESQFLYKAGEQQIWDGEFAAAFDTLERAVAGLEQSGSAAAAARVLILLGRLHWLHGRPDRGLAIHQQARDTFERLNDREGTVQALSAIASGLHGVGRLTEALATQERALSRAITSGGQRNINLQRLQLARLYLAARQPQRAKALVDEVAASSDAFARRLAPSVMTEALFALGDYTGARDAATEALERAPELGARPQLLAFRARIEDKLAHPDRALADIARAIEEIERLRPRLVQTDPMKQGFGEQLQWVFDFAVDLRARHGEPASALEAAEQARGRAFLDLLATQQVPALAADAHISELRRIDSDIHQIAAKQSAEDGLKSDAMETLRARWRTADPELRSLVVAEPFSLSQLSAASTRLNSTIVDYWVGAERTFVWVIGPGGLIASASVPAGFERIARLVRRATDSSSEAFVTGAPLVRKSAPKQPWRELHDLLIRPIASALPRRGGSLLTIIPHGPLSRLSFAALLDGDGRYLLERYALHYVPAGAVLEQTARKVAQGGADRTFLLVAEPGLAASGPDGKVLPALPGAAREIARIARLVPAGAAMSLTGAAAREDRVRAAMPERTVVHFATHAVLRDDQSLGSFLALGRSGRDADGRLTAQEIYSLKLHASLVVLSACRTAAGRVTGDGIVGLTRAFFYAGTPSVVATLWNLADVSGPQVMPAFYGSWIGGKDKGQALREAQLALLARLRAGRVTIDSAAGKVTLEEDPFLWAGYVLLGEPR